jgi:hypothetical protein
MRRALFGMIAILLAGRSLCGQTMNQSAFPLEKGTRWTYSGTIGWGGVFPNPEHSIHISWVTEVIDTLESPTRRIAIVKGMPQELAWYREGQPPSFSLLLQSGNKLYRLPVKENEDPSDLAHNLEREGSALPEYAELLLDLPLSKGKTYGGEGERHDRMYCWSVDSVTPLRTRIKGFAAGRSDLVYHLAYRTNPDHEMVDFLPRVGILRYIYEHHGTVSSVDMELREFWRPNKKSPNSTIKRPPNPRVHPTSPKSGLPGDALVVRLRFRFSKLSPQLSVPRALRRRIMVSNYVHEEAEELKTWRLRRNNSLSMPRARRQGCCCRSNSTRG